MEKTLRTNNPQNSCSATNNLGLVFTYVNLLAISLIIIIKVWGRRRHRLVPCCGELNNLKNLGETTDLADCFYN